MRWRMVNPINVGKLGHNILDGLSKASNFPTWKDVTSIQLQDLSTNTPMVIIYLLKEMTLTKSASINILLWKKTQNTSKDRGIVLILPKLCGVKTMSIFILSGDRIRLWYNGDARINDIHFYFHSLNIIII
jgi:hypothetical protein